MKIEIGNGTAYLGDCLEVMKTIPNNSIDCIITEVTHYELLVRIQTENGYVLRRAKNTIISE